MPARSFELGPPPPRAGSRRIVPRLHPVRPAALAWVVAGGCIGGPLRYAADEMLVDPGTGGHGFPWVTFGINVIGAALLAILVVVIAESTRTWRYLREFAGVGILGSFTTYSTWMVQTHDRLTGGDAAVALIYLGSSLVCGLLAAVSGVWAGRVLLGRRRRI